MQKLVWISVSISISISSPSYLVTILSPLLFALHFLAPSIFYIPIRQFDHTLSRISKNTHTNANTEPAAGTDMSPPKIRSENGGIALQKFQVSCLYLFLNICSGWQFAFSSPSRDHPEFDSDSYIHGLETGWQEGLRAYLSCRDTHSRYGMYSRALAVRGCFVESLARWDLDMRLNLDLDLDLDL